MRLQRCLDRWATNAGLDARGPAGLCRSRGPGRADARSRLTAPAIPVPNGRLDAADDRGAAAEGNDGDVRPARPVEHGTHVRFVRRKGDEVWRVGEVPGIGTNGLRI